MKEILDYQLLNFGNFTFHAHNLLGLAILVIITWIILRLLSRGIRKNKKIDEGA